jgi:hypothetical protein
VDQVIPEIQYELPVWNVPEPAAAYLISIDQVPEEDSDLITRPTTRPRALNSLDLPFSDYDHSMIVHSPTPKCSFENLSIPINNVTSTLSKQELITPTDSEVYGINTMRKLHRISPDCVSCFQNSMTTGLQYKKTEAQSGSTLTLLGSKPLLRLDSEIIVTALADVPFLK